MAGSKVGIVRLRARRDATGRIVGADYDVRWEQFRPGAEPPTQVGESSVRIPYAVEYEDDVPTDVVKGFDAFGAVGELVTATMEQFLAYEELEYAKTMDRAAPVGTAENPAEVESRRKSGRY